MKIKDIRIDGFGIWHDLQLERLSPQLTAFYGANEAGKTTLMQFTRAVLYGISPARRSRYLPPVNGGRPGGALEVLHDGQTLNIQRIADRGPEDWGLVRVTTGEGETTGDRLLREALAEVDESTFNHVFAIGLGEIQHLGALSDTQAATWLYRLTSGLDRISLYDVIQGIRRTRSDLLAAPVAGQDGQESTITRLLNRREVLRGEIRQLSQRNRQWAQLEVRKQELDQEIISQQARVREYEQRARTIEIAVALKPNWRKRNKISAQLAATGEHVPLPEDALTRLETWQQKIEKHQREADVLSGQRQQLREESQRLGINKRLLKNRRRIDALGEQRDWMQALAGQIEELEGEAEQLEALLASEQERLGQTLGVSDREHLQVVRQADLENLQPQIQDVQAIQQQVERARQALETVSENERSLQVKIESATVGGERHGLPMDIREASDLVAQLRGRQKVEQRLDQLQRHELELEQQSHELLDDQVMPLSLFNWSLAAVVFGALFVGLWLLVPNSPLGGAGPLLALGGLATGIFCFMFKSITENAAADKLEACQHQMEVVCRQIKEAAQEKEALDADLSLTDGSVTLTLQAAERHLAELENILPMEAQRKQANHEVSSAAARLKMAEEKLSQAFQQWRSKLVGLGFSQELDPHQLLVVTERYTALGDIENRARLRREAAAARERELKRLTQRIRNLAEEVDCVLESEETEIGDDGEEYEVEISPLEQLEHLLSERRQQRAGADRRRELIQRAQQLKATEVEHRRAMQGLCRRRDALFHAADCEDEAAYRQLFQQQQTRAQLHQQREGITREIQAAIGQQGSEETYAELLSPAQVGQLESAWEQATAALETQQQELTKLAGERGAIVQEQTTLSEDRSPAEAQLNLSCTEQQLARARQSWREHATVNRVLERIRSEYEANRQPETLAETSRILQELTGGEYVRVWTPLANDILLVENAAGDSLAVEYLSRGTREQLFLSIRLALVATFARRGMRLPLVLDDVLVNFDAVRAQRAAQVLTKFASGGHQVLLFTCHEHMWHMFQALQADCRRLPSRCHEVEASPVEIATAPPEPTPEPHPKLQPKPQPKPKPKAKQKQQQQQQHGAETSPSIARAVFYDYPFVEKLEVEEAPAPLPAEPESAATEYDWCIPKEPAGGPLAYILNDAGGGQLSEPGGPERIYHDHLEPRRA